MIPLFLTKGDNEKKNFTSETKLSNFKQENHYQLFNHCLNINFHILTHPPLSQLHLHFHRIYPAGIYLFKVNNRNTRTRCVICSKLTIKTPERRH